MYLIKLLTEKGIKEIIFNSKKDNLQRLENEIFEKYGNFYTLSSEKID